MGLPREPRALPASCPLSQLEDEPCTVKGCYKLQPSRAALYATFEGCGALAAGGIAVTCEFEGEVAETARARGASPFVTGGRGGGGAAYSAPAAKTRMQLRSAIVHPFWCLYWLWLALLFV